MPDNYQDLLVIMAFVGPVIVLLGLLLFMFCHSAADSVRRRPSRHYTGIRVNRPLFR